MRKALLTSVSAIALCMVATEAHAVPIVAAGVAALASAAGVSIAATTATGCQRSTSH
jgi:hypothetical protein